MPSPPIQLFLTTIASQPALRQRQEYLLRILQVKKIPFTSYDLASDEEAKRLWKRKAPLDKQQLPGILVGGRFPGPFSEFEEAVEYGELDIFLRLKEEWSADDDDTPKPPAQPIGVPGAVMPLQMTPEHLRAKIMASPQSSPSKVKGTPVNKITNDFDLGTQLVGYGLQGVRATEDELRDLVAELGLDGDEAGDLVKGLAGEETRPSDEPGHSSTSVDSHSEPSAMISSTEPAPASRADPVATGEESEAVPQGSENISKVETKDIISEDSGTSDPGVKGSDHLLPTSSNEAPESVVPVPEEKTDESDVTKTPDKAELSSSDTKDAESGSS